MIPAADSSVQEDYQQNVHMQFQKTEKYYMGSMAAILEAKVTTAQTLVFLNQVAF